MVEFKDFLASVLLSLIVGVTVEVLGTEQFSNDGSCENHHACRAVVDLDMVVRLQCAQIADLDGDNVM